MDKLKEIAMEIDENSAELDMGIHNLMLVVEAAQDRELSLSTSKALTCVIQYLSDIEKSLAKNVKSLLESTRTSDNARVSELVQKITDLLKEADAEQLELILIFAGDYLKKCKGK